MHYIINALPVKLALLSGMNFSGDCPELIPKFVRMVYPKALYNYVFSGGKAVLVNDVFGEHGVAFCKQI